MVRVVKIVSEQNESNIVAGHSIRTITLQVEDVMSKVVYEVTTFAYPSDRDDAMKYYSSRKQWDRYFKLKGNFPDLRSVAASTTHKAQGSTYDTVIVDLADIGTCTNMEQTARMAYVALSRPKHRIFIRGQLPARYFP